MQGLIVRSRAPSNFILEFVLKLLTLLRALHAARYQIRYVGKSTLAALTNAR